MGRARELALPLGGAWRCPPACEASAPPGCGDRHGGDPGGRSVFPPSLHPSGAATRSGRLQAGPPLAPGYRPVPEPGRSLCTPRTVRSGTRPPLPAAGEGSAPGERLTPGIPSTPDSTYLCSRPLRSCSRRLESFSQQLWRGCHDVLPG